LAEILEQLYALPDVRKQIGKRCYKRVTDPQFSWEVIGSQFGGIFEDVLRQGEPVISDETVKPKKERKKRGERRLVGSAT
jgi:hypothetical protein